MDSKNMEKFKELLIEERSRILEDLMEDNEEFAGLDETDMGDLVDQAFKLQEKELLINLSQNEQKTLQLIQEALKRIDEGSYGECSSCGKEMGYGRLEALPYATECVECKNKNRTKKQKIT